MKKRILLIIGLCLAVSATVFFVFSNKNPLEVDVSDIELSVEIERFDKEINQIFDENTQQNIQNLNAKYDLFFQTYNEQIIGIGSINNSSYADFLKTFLLDYAVVEASAEVEKEFADIEILNEEITDGFKHIMYYFPNEKLPRVASFIAGFNQSVIVIDSYIGIGLDKYLGVDCKLYNQLNIPEFAKFEMQKSLIPIDIVTAWVQDKFPFQPQSENLLSHMLYYGKILYFLDAIFPNFSEARKNKYTQEQLDYCYYFEKDLWTSMVENKQLFISDHLSIRKYVESAPFTFNFGNDSPPRLANWIGLQIVRSYMNNNDVSIPELMQTNDYQKILNLSQYSPTR